MSSFTAAPRTASFRFFKYLPSTDLVEAVAMLAVALVISVSVNTML
ncbi:hypothetical protein [Nitrospirillum sp. BR 11828]|nr:hypothetical protein [Nitrospirillum sp. BR 11828]MDZ5647433.1 hypothetical protein [Nitrospirillum sp. BR 11828]